MGGGLEPKKGGVLSKLVEHMRITDRGVGMELPEAMRLWGHQRL